MQKKVTKIHLQSGHVKRLSLAGAKPLKLTTLTTLSAVFPKAQSSQSRAKMEAKMKSSGTQNHEKSATWAPQKTLKKKTTKSWTRSPFWCQKRTSISRLCWCPFRALGRPGAKLVPEPPPRASGMVQDPIFNDFRKFLDGFLVAFCVRPLVCHHVFGNCVCIPFWLILGFPHLSAK